MKPISYLSAVILSFFLLSANAFAQVDSTDISTETGKTDGVKALSPDSHDYVFNVQERDHKMSDGVQNALYIFIEGADRKQAQNVWKEFVKQYDGRAKKGLFSSEFRTEDVNVYSVGGTDPISIYSTFNEESNGTEAYIWFQLSDTEFLSSRKYENAYTEAKRIVDNFGIAVKQEVARDELEGEEKILSGFERDMKKLQKENENLHSTIEKAEKSIEKARETIEKNEKAIEKARQDLEKNDKEQEEALLKLKNQQKAVEEAQVKYNAIQ